MSVQDLAAAVRGRRHELGLRQTDLGAEARLSTETIRLIENARQPGYTRRTLATLDQSLRWRIGSSAALIDSGTPPSLASPPGEVDAGNAADERVKRIGQTVLALLQELTP